MISRYIAIYHAISHRITSKYQANTNSTKPHHPDAGYFSFFRLCLCPHLGLFSVWPSSSSFCCPSAGHIIGLTAPPVGRTHTIIRLQTRIRRKDGTENFGGFVYVLDLHNGISCCGFFVCSINFSLSFPATTPRAPTPHRYRTGYHAQGYHAVTTTARLSRLCIYIPAITL